MRDDYSSELGHGLKWAYLLSIVGALLAPVFYIVYISFNEHGFGARIYEFTTDWYRVVLGDIMLVASLKWTFYLALSVVLTAVPLLLGELGAIGGMTLLGHNLNMVSMGIIPIILGIGIDDGIHIVHRFMDQGEKDVPGVFRFAGRAVVITSMTTIVGFGSLIFSSYKGLWSAGLFAILGVGVCLLASITLLPALLQIFVVARRERAAG